MKIKYSKFEINRWDIFFLVIYLSHLLGGIDILFNKKEKVGIIFFVIGISYFVYRFLLVIIIKSKMKFDFSDYEVKIKGLFFEKTIEYSDIKTLTVRKNILGSYDIFLNFDSSMNIYKYFCNLIKDVSIESNHKKSYIFCDIKNKDEILECLLEKIGYPKKEIYIIDDFFETDKKVIINYENTNFNSVKFNFYYFQNNVMPKNYKKYDN